MNKNKILKKLISIVMIISILSITIINAKGTEQERVYEENGKKYLEVTSLFLKKAFTNLKAFSTI